MEYWNHMINTALLGTDKRPLRKEDFTGLLGENLQPIYENSLDAEDRFLQVAAVIYNYRQCGSMPIKNETFSIPHAGNEEAEYASPSAHQVLNDLLQIDSVPLLLVWLNECLKKERIVLPEMLPLLLDKAVKQPDLQDAIVTCAGKRGAWLMQFNAAWAFEKVVLDEATWQTGTVAQRKQVLEEIRKTEPTKGRELLQAVWPQEIAAIKTELLNALRISGSKEDEPFLESILNEKSSKVKEQALWLLKRIPDSKIIQQYWTVLSASVQLKKEKGLLGIGSKTSLEIKLVPVDKAVFDRGIEQLSGKAGVSDEVYILYQLTSFVPPHLWEQHLALTPVEIITLFSKDKQARSLVGAFGVAASRFADLVWLRAVIAASENALHVDAFKLLPQKEAEAYALRFMDVAETAQSLIQYMLQASSGEWSIAFSKAVLKHTASNGYQYPRAFYNNLAHLLPIEIINELERCTPPEPYQREQWTKNSEYIIELLTLRIQTLQSFQS